MGTMELPSIPGTGGLCFLPQRLAAFDPAGANKPPVKAPSTARNERRLHPNFTSSFLSTWRRGWIDGHRATYDFNRRIATNPFHSMRAFEKTRYPAPWTCSKTELATPGLVHRRCSRYGTKPRTSILIL